MKKYLKVIGNTCLALSSGLFTGGVVTSIISNEFAKEVLVDLFFPALVLFYGYLICNVVSTKSNDHKIDSFAIISSLIIFLFVIHLVMF